MDSQCSSWHVVPSGFPQGSILGPLLGPSLSVYDIPKLLSNSCLMFADDLKLFCPITSSVNTFLVGDSGG